MLTIFSSPLWSTVAAVFIALLVYVWKGVGSYIEARTPQNVQMLLERVVPALVEATEKTKAYASGKDKLNFAFSQLDRIAKDYGVSFSDATARAFIEQHVLTLPHTGRGQIAPPANASFPNRNTPADTNPMPAPQVQAAPQPQAFSAL